MLDQNRSPRLLTGGFFGINLWPLHILWMRAFIARFMGLLRSHEGRDDEAGLFARLILAEIECLWGFLEEEGVEPTNNRAERAIPPGVMQRKRSLGTQSEKGDSWLERILLLRHTCRIQKTSSFNILVDALPNFFAGQQPNLALILQMGQVTP